MGDKGLRDVRDDSQDPHFLRQRNEETLFGVTTLLEPQSSALCPSIYIFLTEESHNLLILFYVTT